MSLVIIREEGLLVLDGIVVAAVVGICVPGVG